MLTYGILNMLTIPQNNISKHFFNQPNPPQPTENFQQTVNQNIQ